MNRQSARNLQQLQDLLIKAKQTRRRAEELYRNLGEQLQRGSARNEARRAERLIEPRDPLPAIFGEEEPEAIKYPCPKCSKGGRALGAHVVADAMIVGVRCGYCAHFWALSLPRPSLNLR